MEIKTFNKAQLLTLNQLVQALPMLERQSYLEELGELWEYLRNSEEYLVDERDYNIYSIVRIGDQEWLGENLRYKGEIYYENANWPNLNYGLFYDPDKALQENLAPRGFIIPSRADWVELEEELGIFSRAEDLLPIAWYTGVGNQLKSTLDWKNKEGNNSSGFDALPTGVYSTRWKQYQYLGEGTSFFSSTKMETGERYAALLDQEYDVIHLGGIEKYQVSVIRCLREREEPNILTDKRLNFILKGIERQFFTKVHLALLNVLVQALPLEKRLEYLQGQELIWSWISDEKKYVLDERDYNIYSVVRIGDQEWLGENLRYEGVQHYKRKGEEETILDGYFYDWSTMMSGESIAPKGWRIPSDQDWVVLEDSLGAADYKAWGEEIGFKLKAQSGWKKGGNGSDEVGFSVLPSGMYTDGYFDFEQEDAYFWTATAYDEESAWNRVLSYNESSIISFTNDKSCGLSCRCVREVVKKS